MGRYRKIWKVLKSQVVEMMPANWENTDAAEYLRRYLGAVLVRMEQLEKEAEERK